jgi:hypothetical protein
MFREFSRQFLPVLVIIDLGWLHPTSHSIETIQ